MEKKMANRIDQKFSELTAHGRKGLFPFLVAGQPDVATTIHLIRRFEKLGVAGIELGFPFTDPVADGPVIQNAFSQALEHGVTVAKILDAVREARPTIAIPLIAMISASIVYKIGPEVFLARAAQAGIDGFIIPDLSIEEAPGLAQKVAAHDLRLAMLVAPNTPADRQEKIAKSASGFLYYMSVAGITGERDQLPDDLPKNVARLKSLSGIPVLVGFGIKTPAQVRQVNAVADGAIVGSAIVRRITQAKDQNQTPDQIVDTASTYIAELMTGI
jgi:tryptophan synthase alpha chain